MSSIGNVQKNVGRAYTKLSVIGAAFFAFVTTAMAIGLAIAAFIPFKFDDSSHFSCSHDNFCPSDEECKDGTCQKKDLKSTRHLFLLWFAIPIFVVGLFSLGAALVINHMAQKSRAVAQLAGTAAEIQMAKTLLS